MDGLTLNDVEARLFAGELSQPLLLPAECDETFLEAEMVRQQKLLALVDEALTNKVPSLPSPADLLFFSHLFL